MDKENAEAYFYNLNKWVNQLHSCCDSYRKRKIAANYSFSQIEVNRILNLNNKNGKINS